VLLSETNPARLGGAFLIMERMAGDIMLDYFFRPSTIFFRLPRLLAETQARLQSLDSQALLQAIEAEHVPARALTVADWMERVQRQIEEAELDGLQPAIDWVRQNSPPDRLPTVICHGDFHPSNLLVHKGAVSGVIDWPWVRIAAPEYDVGSTIAILSQGPVDPPRFVHPVVNWFRRGMVSRYLRAYRYLRPLDDRALRYFEALRCLGFLLEAGQQRQADAGVIPRPEKRTAFAATYVVNSVAARFCEITALTLTLPPLTK